MAQWRLAQSKDIFFLDITAKSGLLCFAPEMQNVMRYKRGELDEVEYTELYLAKMQESKRRYPVRWRCLAEHPRIAFACYCKPFAYCHRVLFTQLVKDHLESQGLDVVLEGELVKEKGAAT